MQKEGFRAPRHLEKRGGQELPKFLDVVFQCPSAEEFNGGCFYAPDEGAWPRVVLAATFKNAPLFVLRSLRPPDGVEVSAVKGPSKKSLRGGESLALEEGRLFKGRGGC